MSGICFNTIDAIAVSFGPGLVGSLLVGVETAKALAYALGKPLIAVNHLEGHIYSNWLESNSKSEIRNPKPKFPLIGLIVSGGHTDLILMRRHGDFKLLGSTLDDACGEAFDKVAKFLGLGYPGGPEIERVAQQFTVHSSQFTVNLPRPMIGSSDFNFSFSGLKTAVVNEVKRQTTLRKFSAQANDKRREEIAYEFQKAVCDVLISKTVRAAKKYRVKSIAVGGGVAANNRLRSQLTVHSSEIGIPVYFPEKKFSVDNGAMIAAAAFYKNKTVDPLKLFADSNLHF